MASRAPNIYRSDEVLLTVGVVMAILGIPPVIADVSSLSFPSLASLFFAVGSVATFVAGLRVRTRERQIQALWRLLDDAREVRVADVQASVGMSADAVRDAVQELNRGGHGQWVLDERAGVVVDGRLRTTVRTSGSCQSCGAPTSRSMTLSAVEQARCEHCDAPLPTDTINQLKLQALTTMRAEQPAPDAVRAWRPGLGILLFVFFWPAGLVYLLTTRRGVLTERLRR